MPPLDIFSLTPLSLCSVPQNPFLNVGSFARVITLAPRSIRRAILQEGQQASTPALKRGKLPLNNGSPSLRKTGITESVVDQGNA